MPTPNCIFAAFGDGDEQLDEEFHTTAGRVPRGASQESVLASGSQPRIVVVGHAATTFGVIRSLTGRPVRNREHQPVRDTEAVRISLALRTIPRDRHDLFNHSFP